MPWMAGAMLGGSVISGLSGRRSANRMRREMRRQREQRERMLKFAKEQWQYYQDTYGDTVNMMVADATEGVQADYDGVTGRVAADVEGQFANQRDRQRRDMMRYGLDPSSGRFQSSDRSAGLQQATVSALGQNQAREAERRNARDMTWQRRAAVGQMGANLMANGAQGVMGAMDGMANMHGQNAQYHGGMANNLFAQAGQMGMYGAMGLGSHFANRGGSPAGSVVPTGMNVAMSPGGYGGAAYGNPGATGGGFDFGGGLDMAGAHQTFTPGM